MREGCEIDTNQDSTSSIVRFDFEISSLAPSFLPVSIVIEVSLQSIIGTSGFGGVLRLERVKTTLLVVERERGSHLITVPSLG